MSSHTSHGSYVAAAVVGAVVATLIGAAAPVPASGATLAAPTAAPSASTAVTSRVDRARVALEAQLQLRSVRLTRLAADLAGSQTLTGPHAALLGARVSTERSSIAGLVAKVPGDTTMAELRADRWAMLRDNRVFVVMSPQVFETIDGDAALSQATALQAQEPTLLGEVNALAGQPGYRTAIGHYDNFKSRLAGIDRAVAALEERVLAQTPQGYPRNWHVFVEAGQAILRADVSLAYASYDATVISLTTGGTTTS